MFYIIFVGGIDMEKNVGNIDRAIRIILGVVLLFLAYKNGGVWWVLGILGIVLIITALLRFCILYVPLGIKTK